MRLASDTQPRAVDCTGIACVFVNPLFAKYKYAKHMLSLLHYVQAAKEDLPEFPRHIWGEEPEVMGENWKRDVKFSVSLQRVSRLGQTLDSYRPQVLYSGVGKDYYASARMGAGKGSRPGWVFKHTETRTFDVDLDDKGSAEDEAPSEWQYLDAKGVRDMEKVAAGIISRRMSKGDVQGQAQVAVMPTR
jgi:hypothetical protein